MTTRLNCDSIAYRQGYLEVRPNIHPGHVNLEVWNISPDVGISGKALDEVSGQDGAVVGNVEIEMTLDKAKELVRALQQCIDQAESSTTTSG